MNTKQKSFRKSTLPKKSIPMPIDNLSQNLPINAKDIEQMTQEIIKEIFNSVSHNINLIEIEKKLAKDYKNHINAQLEIILNFKVSKYLIEESFTKNQQIFSNREPSPIKLENYFFQKVPIFKITHLKSNKDQKKLHFLNISEKNQNVQKFLSNEAQIPIRKTQSQKRKTKNSNNSFPVQIQSIEDEFLINEKDKSISTQIELLLKEKCQDFDKQSKKTMQNVENSKIDFEVLKNDNKSKILSSDFHKTNPILKKNMRNPVELMLQMN